MVQPTQHGNSANRVRLVWWRRRKRWRVRNPLAKPLMGSSLVEVHDIRFEKAVQLLLLEDQEVIQAFSSYTSQEAFTDGTVALQNPLPHCAKIFWPIQANLCRRDEFL
jgi:hypothetical protein